MLTPPESPKLCEVQQISENLFKCCTCGFKYHTNFDKNCFPIKKEVEPYKCIHTGDQVEALDTKNCNCVGRGSQVTIHRCNLYNKDCGLLSLLKWNKRKELEDKGVINCTQCPNRFDKQETTENDQKGV